MIVPDAVRRLTALTLVVLLGLAAVACTQPAAPEGGATTAPMATGAVGETEKEEGGSAAVAGDAVKGQEAFGMVCVACHGPDAKGMEGLGKDLHANAFVGGKTDDEMVAFLEVGRPATDPLNTTKVDMPPKGGNPAYTDEDLYNIVAYLRTLE